MRRRTGSHGTVREDDADGRRFADRHGFRVRRHTFESIVDASSLDRTAMQAPDPPGVTVTTLAELGDELVLQLLHRRRPYAARPGHRIGAEAGDDPLRARRRYGFLSTSNDSANAPMLAVNRRLGYRPLPGILQVVRPIGWRPSLSDLGGT